MKARDPGELPMLTTAQLIELRALTAGPDGAAPSTRVLAERGMLLALVDEVLAGREGTPTVADLAERRVARLVAIIAPLLAEGRVAGIDGFQRVGRQVWTRAERIAATIVADEQENAA